MKYSIKIYIFEDYILNLKGNLIIQECIDSYSGSPCIIFLNKRGYKEFTYFGDTESLIYFNSKSSEFVSKHIFPLYYPNIKVKYIWKF